MKNTPATPADLIALTLTDRAGRQAIHRAIQLANRAERPLGTLLGAPVKALLDLAAPGEEAAAAALGACGEHERQRAAAILSLCAAAGIRCWTCLDPGYPRFLREHLADQAPPLLFYQGNEALLEARGAGIVGRRKPSMEGAGWARAAAGHFAEEGVTVVSGGADGIDLEAHRAALKADGTTVVILPEGLHAHHADTAIRTGLRNGQCLLVSEFLPSDDWRTHRAMTRNRTIAACSRMICVIEPRATGGSMFTAEQALAQGKPVFYWGGACRDGALRDRHGAFPLARGGMLAVGGIAGERYPRADGTSGQGDLFEG